MYGGDNLEHKRVFFMLPYQADSTVNVPVAHRLKGSMVEGGGETMHVVTVQILAGEKSAFLDLAPEFVTGFDGDIEESYTLLSEYQKSMKFVLRDPSDITKGWDDTGPETWTSVGVGKTNTMVKFVGGSSDFELVVDPGSASYLSIANEAITGGDTNFTITGTADSKILGTEGAKILCRIKGTTYALATLHVHVLPPRIIHFNVFHASDEGPGRVPASAIPAGVPSPTALATELNDTYWEQTNVHFIANAANNPFVLSTCDGSFASNGACYYGFNANGHATVTVEQNIIINQLQPKAQQAGIGYAEALNIIIVKNVIRHAPRTEVNGITEFADRYPFLDATAPLSTFAHETGHCLMLATRNDAGDNAHQDNGMAPDQKRPLMFPTNLNRGRWLRQEDWRLANDYAGSKYK